MNIISNNTVGKSLFSVSKPNPIGKIDRKQVKDVRLKYPNSPAFIPKYIGSKEPRLEQVVDYCSSKNIPF